MCPISRRAFTLIELLIVLAIIGILASILFPVFSRARARARLASCASNIRQVAMAIELYTTDNDERYPTPNVENDRCSWVDLISPYAKSEQIFWCPEFRNGEYCSGCPTNDPFSGALFNGSYEMNSPFVEVVTQGNGYYSIQARSPHKADFLQPAATILLLDGGETLYALVNPGLHPINSTQDLLDRGLKPRHNNGNNVCFADGHVKWLRFEAMTRRNLWTLDGSG